MIFSLFSPNLSSGAHPVVDYNNVSTNFPIIIVSLYIPLYTLPTQSKTPLHKKKEMHAQCATVAQRFHNHMTLYMLQKNFTAMQIS